MNAADWFGPGPWAAALPLLGGLALCAGLWLIVTGLARRPVRLADVLEATSSTEEVLSLPPPDQNSALERLGERLGAHLTLSRRTTTMLLLQGRSRGDFVAEKLIMALLGAGAPAMGAAAAQVIGTPLPVPALLVVVGGVVGWFIPNLLLSRSRRQVRASAGEALFAFVDLVVLERLANQSSTQALTRAAEVSDNVLFRELRASLERHRLEQRPAWQALDDVADRLDVPQLRDVADVMQLDEQGAALGNTLRARVRELRDGHLMAQKIEAQQTSESLTIWMVIPALVFGLILLTPPLLRMVGA